MSSVFGGQLLVLPAIVPHCPRMARAQLGCGSLMDHHDTALRHCSLRWLLGLAPVSPAPSPRVPVPWSFWEGE
jgi:hypothetical protein